MSDEAQTKPLLETILDRLNGVEERLNVRLDRIESEVKFVHPDMLSVRADFTELRSAIREHFPAVN
jgi:hypothetical protein